MCCYLLCLPSAAPGDTLEDHLHLGLLATNLCFIQSVSMRRSDSHLHKVLREAFGLGHIYESTPDTPFHSIKHVTPRSLRSPRSMPLKRCPLILSNVQCTTATTSCRCCSRCCCDCDCCCC